MTHGRFSLGQVSVTRNALDALSGLGLVPHEFVRRHVACDWSEMDADDAAQNVIAIQTGRRILSSFNLPRGGKIWVLTEADRSATTVILPEDY